MAGKNFDISKFAATLKPVSESDHTGPEQIEYIDIGLLDGDERNFYQLTDIDELADNIQMCGLQHPGDGRCLPGASGTSTDLRQQLHPQAHQRGDWRTGGACGGATVSAEGGRF